MLKKTLLLPALLFTCLSAPTYAYLIGANLIIVNNTNVPMDLTITPPKGQGLIIKHLPVHQTTEVYVENGDRTGWLYQTSVAPFSIKDAVTDTEYVNGRTAFYVGGSLFSEYSFLDSVSAGKGIVLNKTYSCVDGDSGYTFQNKIILSGNPGKPAKPLSDRNFVQCIGLKTTLLGENVEGQYYKITCSNNAETIFWKNPGECTSILHHGARWYSDGCYWVKSVGKLRHSVLSPYTGTSQAKSDLDKRLGKSYCRSFEKKIS